MIRQRGRELAEKLKAERMLSRTEFAQLLGCEDEESLTYLRELAVEVRTAHYGRDVYIRGLIEISNYCRNDCYYCGIRRSNAQALRYRLNQEQILNCCETGYALGFRTFVMQGGEDGYYTDQRLTGIIEEIKRRYPDCAVTLSLGERSRESYRRLFEAGADRYLLRHETADEVHYGRLHPPELSLETRKKCLSYLKETGFQTGCGFMVGSPYQTMDNLISDLFYMKELNPEMIGIGPFLPHKDTPFSGQMSGSLSLTLKLLSVIRLMFPAVLLPATTALGTVCDGGRELGILAGANVVMPNLSPEEAKDRYMLYDNKLRSGREAAEGLKDLKDSMEKIGYRIVEGRGDYKKRP